MTDKSHDHLKTPLENFYHWEKSQPDAQFLAQPIDGKWITFTWKEAGVQIRKMASVIRQKDFPPGSKIALMSKNCAHWIMSDLAIMMSGHVSVPIYPNVSDETVSYVLDHSEAKMLFVGKLEPGDWKVMRQGIPSDMDCVDFGIYGLDASYTKWDELVSKAEPLMEEVSRDIDEIMTIIYTSGTTGVPKGVVQKFLGSAIAAEYFVRNFSVTTEDRFFSYLPLSHIAERLLTEIIVLYSGASVHYVQSLDTFKENLAECEPTLFLAVPRIWTKFMNGVQAKFSPTKLNLLLSIPIINNIIRKKIRQALGVHKARICLTGAAPIAPSQLRWFDRLGITIYEVYGMTENNAYSHANVPGARKIGTVGKSLEGVETKISEDGEICIKSDATMVEYYKEPEKTADAIRDGYLHTGDKGEIDDEGFVRITGRVKDMFKTSKGKYVAPNPIELLFAKNEHIEQICVVGPGVPQPMALVELSEAAGAIDKESISESLKESLMAINPDLEHHEQIHRMVVVSEKWTPDNGILTPTMKIKRNSVDKKYQDKYTSWYEHREEICWET